MKRKRVAKIVDWHDLDMWGHINFPLSIKWIVIFVTSKRFFWCLENMYVHFLHSGLNTAWHFWFSTRFSCCLKIKSVENILRYFPGQFLQIIKYVAKPRENIWNCSIKHPKIFKTDFIFKQQKIKFKPECQVWSCYYATGGFVAVLGDFYTEMRPQYEKILLSSTRPF